ncbi:MAG: hypothetical protein DRG78_00330 [Epsilonproteobacteria bacterium]|nr:MAG: hypothetical protein DRG78_00330 [Campylobacterota bacterium]
MTDEGLLTKFQISKINKYLKPDKTYFNATITHTNRQHELELQKHDFGMMGIEKPTFETIKYVISISEDTFLYNMNTFSEAQQNELLLLLK